MASAAHLPGTINFDDLQFKYVNFSYQELIKVFKISQPSVLKQYLVSVKDFKTRVPTVFQNVLFLILYFEGIENVLACLYNLPKFVVEILTERS